MKLVVFGPGRRVGVVRGDDAIDASLATAKYLHERKREPSALTIAEALVPSGLENFIEGGDRSLDQAREAVDYLFGAAADRQGLGGAPLVHRMSDVQLWAPRTTRARVA